MGYLERVRGLWMALEQGWMALMEILEVCLEVHLIDLVLKMAL
jgi:hypothetical protein